MWIVIQAAAIITAIWYISAFFIAACVGGSFAADFSLLLGVISYSSLSLMAVYYLFNANQAYYSWPRSRDQMVRYIFPNWHPDWEDKDEQETESTQVEVPLDTLANLIDF